MALSFYGLLASSALFTYVLGTPSVDIAYCASANTATTSSNTSIYQSDGLCYDFCSDDYAYALVSGTECWCSDYTPSKSIQVDTSECNGACAGYPSDWCGGDGLYAYMALSKSPSGTADINNTDHDSTNNIYNINVINIVHLIDSININKFQTVTAAGGIVQTVTVTPSSSSAPAASTSHKSVSTGAAVGIAVGVVGAAVLGGIGAFMLWRRKRREREAIYAEHNSKANSPRGTTPNASSPKVSEVSAGPFADQSGRRRSALMPIDPRIDPAFSGIYARTADNKSRDSVNSLRDDHDYSRRVHQPNGVLRAMNPDPENE
ncbi:er membrane protein [Ophiostoma piceae UAMH 11346]|uniref:Er membrane protein n=1 Tax=Ophiostoma piceae (strain UAMH 11346) TaxID=1262450 RepID=S3CNV7_OPHP1|nr:er membrane protein [Ophiostoma piceae UAMH 11346]